MEGSVLILCHGFQYSTDQRLDSIINTLPHRIRLKLDYALHKSILSVNLMVLFMSETGSFIVY